MRILFVAPYPDVSGPVDGFVGRVAEIDGLLGTDRYHKDYLVLGNPNPGNSTQLRSYSVPCGGSTAYHFNWWLHKRAIRSLAKQYDVVYVHSVHQAAGVLHLYTDTSIRIYTDMHGVVPEEILLAGGKFKAQAKSSC